MEGIVFPTDRTLETADLVLRPLRPADLEDYFALCSDAEVMKTWGTPVHQTIEDTRGLLDYLEGQLAAGNMIRWAITRKGDDRLIGDVGYWRFVRERRRGEVGAKLARPAGSRGYMTQALTAIVVFGLERMSLNSVEANVAPTNGAALRLVEKVGFEKEGHLHGHSFDSTTGTFIDTFLFSIVKGRWTPPR